MDSRKIERMGRARFSRSVHPIKSSRVCSYPILGFDTEYVSKTSELISFQIHAGESGIFVPIKRGEKLTPLKIYHAACKLLNNNPSDILLVCFFSIAELQHLPVQSEGINIREFSNGSLDVDFTRGLDGRTIHVFDIARFFPKMSLAKVSKDFGLEKLEAKRDEVTRANLKDKEFRRYALHDAFLCFEIARIMRETFIGETGIDPIIYKTSAGTSQAVFRRNFVKKDYFNNSNGARTAGLRAYRGGHAEVFERGKLKGNFAEYDIKSAYPNSAIKIGEFPIQKSWREYYKLSDFLKCRGGFALVRFQFPDCFKYPFLPVDVKDATLFPISGETWSGLEEIKLALENKCKISLVESWGYRRGTKCVSEYFKWCLSERAKSPKKSAKSFMFKLLANGLTGKFVQNIERIDIDLISKLAEMGGYNIDDILACSWQEQLALIQAVNTMLPPDKWLKAPISVGACFMPEWSALITSYTRAALAEMLISSDAVYCHTDSVWGRREPKCSRLEFERQSSGQVTIIRRAFGSIGEVPSIENTRGEGATTHVAIHSIWNATAGIDMINRFTGEDFTLSYKMKRPIKYRESLRRGSKRGKFGIWIWETRKGSTMWDNKRFLYPDGTTRAWKNVGEYLDFKENSRKIIKDELSEKFMDLKGVDNYE